MIKLAKSANTSTSHNINKQHEHGIKSHPPLSIMGMTFDPSYIHTQAKIAVIVYHQF